MAPVVMLTIRNLYHPDVPLTVGDLLILPITFNLDFLKERATTIVLNKQT